MSEHIAGLAGTIQHTLKTEASWDIGQGLAPNLAANATSNIFDRLRNRAASLIATVVAGAAVLASPLINEQPAYADAPQVTVGMPFDGNWAYSNLTTAACGPNANQTSHPACHETYIGDWATDLYAAAGTEVKLNVGSGSPLSFAWESASGTCGETRRVKVFANNNYVGRIHFTHLKDAAPTSGAPTNGMVIGKIANLACNPGGSGKHMHMEFDNASANTHACYINYSNASYTAGIPLGAGTILGKLGSGNGGDHEACAGEPPSPTPPYLSRMLFVRSDDMLFAKDNLSAPWADETGAGWVRTDSATQPGTIAVGGADGTTQAWINGCNALYAKGNLGQGGWVQETDCNTARSIAVSDTNLQVMLDVGGGVWAKYGISPGGWTQEAAPGTAAAVAAGGDTQMMLSTCGAVYAKNGVSYGGWVEELPCGDTRQIAVSHTGLQMILNACGAFYSRMGIGAGGWWAEGDCGWGRQIGVGGDTHLFLSSSGGVYTKTSMGYGGWMEEAAPGTATAAAVGKNGRRVMITSDSSVYAKDSAGAGGWVIQAGPGNAKAVAVS
jgi:hypothetical protein